MSVVNHPINPGRRSPPLPLPQYMAAAAAALVPFVAGIESERSLTPPGRRFSSSVLLDPSSSTLVTRVTARPRKSIFHRGNSSYLKRSATIKVCCNQVKVDVDVDDEACELVNGSEVIIGEGKDSIRAYLLKPIKNNNGTGVLLLPDAFGFEDSLTRDFAYRIACTGYNVLVPDMFRGNPWKKGQSISEFEHWLTAHSSARVASDIEMSAKWLTDEFLSAGISKKLGIIGFQFGGVRMIEMLAKDEQGIFGAGVCFYGMPMKTSLAKDVNVPVLFISGDSDPLCPVNELLDMERSIRGAKVMIYKGRGHEFAHRPKSQEEDVDAENAFIATRKWLQNGF